MKDCFNQFSSVTQSGLTLWDPMDCSTTSLPVCHQLPELAQTCVHWVWHPYKSRSLSLLVNFCKVSFELGTMPLICEIFSNHYFLINLFFNWRIIALQNFVVFCQISTWVSHTYTYAPSLLNLPPISLPIPPLWPLKIHVLWGTSVLKTKDSLHIIQLCKK